MNRRNKAEDVLTICAEGLISRSAALTRIYGIDLYCGLGGWAEGFLAEGYRVIGFDIERLSQIQECCLCLKTEREKREQFQKCGRLYCCRSCLAPAVELAYSEAVAMVTAMGRIYGFGNLISRLKDAWSQEMQDKWGMKKHQADCAATHVCPWCNTDSRTGKKARRKR